LFNLLVSFNGWGDARDTIRRSRVFEHTDEKIKIRCDLSIPGSIQEITRFPALFMQEIGGPSEFQPRIGRVIDVRPQFKQVKLEYMYLPDLPPLQLNRIKELSSELEIEDLEFTRTHWSIKDVDLFEVLYRDELPRLLKPQVFTINNPERVDSKLVSVMMPFDARFDSVHKSIEQAVSAVGLQCKRADNIWENHAVIQDVVSLIDTARIVICDCTDRNPNVFYEAGIAHTLGREVILIAQSLDDIPFDLRHLRILRYLANSEGLEELSEKLREKLQELVGSTEFW